MKKRICIACGLSKPRNAFYGDNRRCKACIFGHKRPQLPGVRVRCFIGVPVDFAGFPVKKFCQRETRIITLERITE